MREIKFRVVDTLANKVYTGEEIYDFEKAEGEERHSISGLDIVRGCEIGGFSNILLQQYTELKDKNGKEIYEGDILKLTVGTKVFHPRVIEWDTDTMGFVLKKYGNGNEYGKSKRGSIHNGVMKEYEIIGNIYENSDLMQIV